MYLRLILAVCLIAPVSLARADFTIGMSLAEVVSQKINPEGTCGQPNAAKLCRVLPWAPRYHEGVYEVGAAGYVFLEETPPPGHPLQKWLPKFEANRRLEYYSYFALLSPAIAETLTQTPFAVLYLVLLTPSGNGWAVKAASMVARDAIIKDAQRYAALSQELESVTSEWIPPEDFVLNQQFKLVE